MPSGTALELFVTSGTVVENNWIGTADGLTQGNLSCTAGIHLDTQNDDVLIKGNLISGILGHGQGPHHAGQLFGRGVFVSGTANDVTFDSNMIGPDIDGNPVLGSVWGVDLGDPVTHPLSASGLVFSGNEIAGHILTGVTVGRVTDAARLTANSIHDNGWLGIDLIPTGLGYGVTPNDAFDADTGGNSLQNTPTVQTVTRVGGDLRVEGMLHSSAGDDFTVEVFTSAICDDSGAREGETFLGSFAVVTDAKGDAAFDVPLAGISGATADITLPFVLPPGIPTATELWMQWGVSDVAAVKAVALSNARMGLTP